MLYSVAGLGVWEVRFGACGSGSKIEILACRV